MKQQDEKAQKIITAFRARYPGGKVPQGESLPPPPPELTRLWEERKAIILHARDRLREAFGEQKFKQFDAFLNNRPESSTTHVLNLGTH